MGQSLSHSPRHQNRNQRGHIQHHNLGKMEKIKMRTASQQQERRVSGFQINLITGLSQFCNNAPLKLKSAALLWLPASQRTVLASTHPSMGKEAWMFQAAEHKVGTPANLWMCILLPSSLFYTSIPSLQQLVLPPPMPPHSVLPILST